MNKKIDQPTLTDEERTECKELKEKHINILIAASESYNKAILTLSTATLGFTFAFIELSKNKIAFNGKCLLVGSWFLLILAVAFILLSLLADQYVSQEKIKNYGWMAKNGKKRAEDCDLSKFIMEKFPVYSGVCFALAITLFSIFVGINI